MEQPDATIEGRSIRLGPAFLAVALGLGLLAEGLLRTTPWGLNVLLVVLATAATAWGVAYRWHVALRGQGRWLAPGIVLFAACLVWRDAPTTNLLNWLALGVVVAVVVQRSHQGAVTRLGIWQLVGSARFALARAVVGLLPVIVREIPWDRPNSHVGAVARGVTLAVPPVFVFGGLFMAADAAFDQLIRDLFRWEDAPHRLLFMGLYAWVLGGLVRAFLVAAPADGAASSGPTRPLLGIVEIGVALGALALLFGAFVALQLPYLFGGASFLAASAALDLRDYARRGFFELVAVTALALPVLLGAHRLLRGVPPPQERAYRVLAAALVVLLFAIVASAFLRLKLYQDLRGQSELRINAAVAVAWLTFLYVWFLATVLRGRANRFWFGAMVSGFGAILLINVLNPQAMVVRSNTGRADADPPVDEEVARYLGPDAIPDLVDAVPALTGRSQCRVAALLLREWPPGAPPADWRTWNYARAQAVASVAANADALRAVACPGELRRR